MTQHRSLDQTPSDTRKLVRWLDALALVLAFAYFALVFFGETAPRILARGTVFAVFCLVVARIVIQRPSRVAIPVTGFRAAGYLIIAVACAFAAWLFPAGSWTNNLLLLAVIPLTLGVGEYFRWRARTRD